MPFFRASHLLSRNERVHENACEQNTEECTTHMCIYSVSHLQGLSSVKIYVCKTICSYANVTKMKQR